MKKYTVIQFFTMIINLFFIFTFIYFLLKVAYFEKYTQLQFNEYYRIIYVSYKGYLTEIFKNGNFGMYDEEQSVMDVLGDRIPITLKMNMLAFAIYLPVGIIFGILSAVYQDSWFDRIVSTVNMMLGSVPIFIMMFLLIMYVGFFWEIVSWKYIEAEGYKNYLIPTIALIIPPISTFTRVIRGEIIESMSSDYVLLARTKGLRRRQAIAKHTIRNALIPLMPEIPTAFLYALTGSFFVEIIYRVPGVATWMYDNLIKLSPIGTNYIAINVPVLMAISIFYSLMAFIIVFVSDVFMKFLEPRIGNMKK